MKDYQSLLRTSNRLVADARPAEFWTDDSTAVISAEEMSIAIQCLPVDVEIGTL